MGYTETYARFYKPNGRINCKAECDDYLTYVTLDENGNEKQRTRVLKSSMSGCAYYAALEITSTGEEPFVYGVVVVCHTRENIWFAYKIIGEDCGPNYYDCPMSILNLLSPTEEKWALEWRQKCVTNHLEKGKARKVSKELAALPVGTIIKFTAPEGLKTHEKGEEVQVLKRYLAGHKRPMWVEDHYYYTSETIGRDYEVVRVGWYT